jgi:excisionase family DNA binding protein
LTTVANSDLLTVSEAAARLRISTGLAYELIRQEILPHVHLGRRVLVHAAALDEWLQHESTRRPANRDRRGSLSFA